MTNASRAARARVALVAHKGPEPGSPESAEAIIDLLTDIHHLLREQQQAKVDDLMDSWLRVAHDHFAAEVREQA